MHTCIHKYIYRPPSCPKVCQTVGPFPTSEFARLRSFTFHHPPRVCQTLSSSKSFFFWSIIDALPCSLLPIKGSGCHPLALTFRFNLRTSTCLLALSTSTFLSMFLSTDFPQLSFKSFQSLKNFFPIALLTPAIVFRTHPFAQNMSTGPCLVRAAAHARILSGLCFVSIRPPQAP